MAERIDKNPWEVLGIAPTYDKEAIRQAYLSAVRRHHPDQFQRDAAQFHQHEEAMKDINRAYQLILAGKAPEPHNETTPPPTGTPGQTYKAPPRNDAPPPIFCPRHHQTAWRRCQVCQTPLCTECIGFYTSLCAKHYRKSALKRYRNRVVREWVPLIIGVAVLREVGLGSAVLLWGVLGYLALLGLGWLRRKRWMGCLALLFFPYSLVLAGLYSLYEGLSQWNKFAMESKHL
ncbi:MAG: J domain-containing protein [Sulfobacillus benefaciens]|uniref:J domain-containing protein n=1 Tax=Sulfobacillus benefaciens TaxID=453960 RepID=A0A2T2XKK4_9FIRM|nr:MAG: J domain-containing protein [Sulfobacillus benefaciens]